jgi:hypothetical protein
MEKTIDKKRGSAQWTVGKLLTIVLLIIFLVLVVYGISTGGFRPIVERIGGMFDNVMILIYRITGTGGEGNTGECYYTTANIDGVGAGMLVLCKDKCNFSLATHDDKLLFRNFVKTEKSFFVQREGGHLLNRDRLIINIEEGERARMLYRELRESIKEVNEEDGMSFKDFSKFDSRPIEFSFSGKGWVFSDNRNYFWDGKVWYGGGAKALREDIILKEMYEMHKKGYIITYGPRGGDKVEYKPNYLIFPKRDGTRSRDEFVRWLNRKIKSSIMIETNKIYCNNDNWWTNCEDETKIAHIPVINEIYTFYQNGNSVTWRYVGSNQTYLILTDTPVYTSEERFNEWVINEKNKWNEDYDKYERYAEILSTRFRGGDIKIVIDNKEYILKLGQIADETNKVVPLIILNLDNDDYGMYFDSKLDKYVLAGYSIGNREQRYFGISKYHEFAIMSDTDWENIKKLNNIYNYLRGMRC